MDAAKEIIGAAYSTLATVTKSLPTLLPTTTGPSTDDLIRAAAEVILAKAAAEAAAKSKEEAYNKQQEASDLIFLYCVLSVAFGIPLLVFIVYWIVRCCRCWTDTRNLKKAGLAAATTTTTTAGRESADASETTSSPLLGDGGCCEGEVGNAGESGKVYSLAGLGNEKRVWF